MSKTASTILLLWGNSASPLPPALIDAVEGGHVGLEIVGTLYPLAAQLVTQGRFARAILVDPAQLTPKVADALTVFQRYALVPMILLPIPSTASAFVKKFSHPVLLNWQDAGSLIARLLQSPTPAGDAGQRASPPAAKSVLPGNTVTSPIDARYDEFDSQPLLSEEEVRALLGAPE